MIQSIYTSVSNANIVPCGKKGLHISSEPIPLLRNNYLGEYRTELEKAKVRKNLGIADDAVIEWANITGHIEDNPDLREALSYKLPEHLKDIIKEDFSSIKGALGWAIEYLSTFVMDTESIAWLKEETASIRQSILEKENLIYTQINSLSDNVLNNIKSITEILGSIQSVNESIAKLNESLLSINVDASILNWIKNASSNSIELIDDSRLEVKISEAENNAITVDEQGLFVLDLSNEVSNATLNIETLQTGVKEIFDTYVTKDLLGGDGDFNFVNQEVFELHTNQANTKFEEIDKELERTVKTGEDGHVDTLYVNTLSNQEGNIKIDKSLEVQTGVPLDVRTVVKSVEELYKLPQNTAYAGMAVANVGDGNIYMLIDPTRITEKGGWKASYESLQIVTCTLEEYEAMAANTNDDYTPKQEGQPFLYQGTYYYIYEDEENSQYYVTKKQIEDWLKAKASAADVDSIALLFDKHKDDYNNTVEELNTLSKQLTDNYSTTQQIAETYATLESLQNTDSKFVDYYTSEEINNTLESYVTKESLRGGLEGEDDFVFVTQNQYDIDKEANLISITTQSLLLKNEENSNTVNITDNNLSVNNKPLAYKEDVPKILLIETKAEYEEMVKDQDTYYYICDDEEIGYLTNITAKEQFYTKLEVNDLIAQVKQDLIDNYIVPLQNEIAALKVSGL